MNLEAAGVTVRIGDAVLLDDVSVAMRGGEVLAIAGPNGAGKSTLLNVLAGDTTPHPGRARLDGRDLRTFRARPLARLRAVLPQRVTLAFPFTVSDVVAMGRAPYGRSPRDASVIAQCLARTGVAHLADRTFPTLSGGEQARVSLARVLAQETPVLLLDEPTASLDLRHQEDVLRTAREHASGGGTVVVVLHDLNLAAAYADTIALLDGGRLRACGPPGEVLRADTLTEVYGHPVDVHPSPNGLLVLPVRSELKLKAR